LKCTYLLASVALASVTSAQVSVDWVDTHAAALDVNNAIVAVAVDGTGRVAAVGCNIYDAGAPGLVSDYEICLYESDGILAWSRTENLNYYDRCCAVAFDGTGGFFVAGYGQAYELLSPSERTLLHYDAFGNLLWNNTLLASGSNSLWNLGAALALCPNGDVIFAGVRNDDLSLERFDPAGNLVWSWIADGGNGGRDCLYEVAVGPGGEVWATGIIGMGAASDTVVVRVTSAGVPVWMRTHPSFSGRRFVVDAAGYTSVAGAVGGDAALARWGPAGHLAWIRTYDRPAHLYEYASRIALDPFGRMMMAGPAWNGFFDTDIAVWCVDTDGSLIWQRTWDGQFSGRDTLGDLVVDATGAVWLCGDSQENRGHFAREDLAIVSWDSTGALRWSWRYRRAAPGTSQAAYVAALSGNSVIVAGSGTPTTGAWLDALILKLTRTAVEFCFGDGSSAPCPCSNASAAEQHAGCANALGLGARLVDQGTSSLADDTLVLAGAQMPDGDALYLQGTSSMSGGAGAPFGDGLSCVGGTLIRLGSSTNVAGASRFPDIGDPSVSVRGLVTTPGSRRTYQVWYRDASAFCTPANFNFSNGLLITWTL
jgi:hypothetical protein